MDKGLFDIELAKRLAKQSLNSVYGKDCFKARVGVDTDAIYEYCKQDVDTVREMFEWRKYYEDIEQRAKELIAAGRFDKPPVKIKNVIFNDPATIVFWTDGTKTVVKCDDSEVFDPEKSLAMAVTKKFLGNDQGRYFNEVKKWTEPYYEAQELLNNAKTMSDLDKSLEHLREVLSKFQCQ